MENTETGYKTIQFLIKGLHMEVEPKFWKKCVCTFKYFAIKVLDYATLLNYMVQVTCLED